jgi:hypothetical protein
MDGLHPHPARIRLTSAERPLLLVLPGAPSAGTSVDGLGFCFAPGRLAAIRTAVHG